MARRTSTAIRSLPMFVAIVVMGLFALVVSGLGLDLTAASLGALAAAAIAIVIVRALIGTPATIARVGPDAERAMGALSKRPRFLLVTMPINHFGEKLRWCMDLLDVDYEESTVAGVLSVYLRGRTVPWLVDRHSCSRIGNSDEALWYLSAVHVPAAEHLSDVGQQLLLRTPETMVWEEQLNELGHAIQGWAYYYFLAPGADSTKPLRYWGAYESHVPWPQRSLLRLSFPVLRLGMRAVFELGDDEVHAARRKTIDDLLSQVDSALADREYIAGDTPSYVDIGYCSLIGALLPAEVLPHWANGRFRSLDPQRLVDEVPEEIAEFQRHLLARPAGQHVLRLFESMRAARLTEKT